MPGLTPHDQAETTVGLKEAVVWIPQNVVQACFEEASDKFPLETGGTFMGWWADADTAVITAVVGPGPNAHHGRHSFQPDEAWQLDQIARHYAASGRRETYLGDWHSHPDISRGTLSWIDRRVLRRVITTPSARCPSPLMAIVWGQSDDWQLTVWRARLRPRPLLWDRLVLEQASVKFATSIDPLQKSDDC